ncbi:hypothetical protein RB614_42295 [Phytohabitans sp. ZYX-F-186]|uniref:Uncharacterized protein n=1 Tax=Phytohabitans maris TaxID=3071409 RepID=A0ABU0ZVU2_9ACTN|nr:hypothetical protein [Phytohabitans sp. ZYX-F-186]MDQ7911141.1 hypothetical protein [Phytohabitans sp. ZYX-F-186]
MAAPVRFFVHLLPPSAAPDWLGWPLASPAPAWVNSVEVEAAEPLPVAAVRRRGPRSPAQPGWYAWRLMTANNRELARSVFRFADPGLCRQAVREVQGSSARLVLSTVADPMTGQFSWRGDLDGAPVAAGNRYEQEQNARYAAKRFLDAVVEAEVTDVVRGLRDRRGPAPSRYSREGQP